MPSTALTRYETDRRQRLDELLAAHRLVGGTGRGRRWRTQQLNNSLVLRLAAEFQGFARDLHDLAGDTFASWAAGGNTKLETVLRARLSEARQLDRGNAHPGSLGSDFGRFGFELWPALAARDPRTASQQESLELLNEARNAIAHDDEARLAALEAQGNPITLRTFRAWQRDLDGLASTLDAEVAAHLGLLFQRATPW
ncbi:MAG: hypothetical protein WD271_11970 [Acidimicrobiia bacterium]